MMCHLRRSSAPNTSSSEKTKNEKLIAAASHNVTVKYCSPFDLRASCMKLEEIFNSSLNGSLGLVPEVKATFEKMIQKK